MSLSTDQISDLVNRFKPLNAEEMPTHILTGDAFDHPVVDETVRERQLPRGRTAQYKLTIADVNEGVYYYQWLDPADIERYAGVFRIVKRGCAAAKAHDGDLSIPDKYFNKQGVIYKNGMLYGYSSWEHHQKKCEQSETRGARTLASFIPGDAEETRDKDGNVLGSVHKTSLNSKLVKIDEKKKDKG